MLNVAEKSICLVHFYYRMSSCKVKKLLLLLHQQRKPQLHDMCRNTLGTNYFICTFVFHLQLGYFYNYTCGLTFCISYSDSDLLALSLFI